MNKITTGRNAPPCCLDEVDVIVEAVVQIIRGDWHVNDRMIA